MIDRLFTNKNKNIRYFVMLLGILIIVFLSTRIGAGDYVNALVIFLGIVVLVLGFKNPILFLFLIFAINEDCFSLIDPKFLSKSNSYNILDLELFLILITFTLTMFKDRQKEYKLKGIVILFIVISFLGAISGYFIFEQPLALGFRAMRFNFFYLIFFPFAWFLREKRNQTKFLNFIIFAATVMAVLNIAQFMGIDVLKVNMVERAGEERFLCSGVLIIMGFFLCLSKSINCDKKRWQFILCAAIQLFAIVFVGKTRMVMLGISLATMLVLFLQKKIPRYVLVLSIIPLIGLGIFHFISTNETMKGIVDITKNEINNNKGNYYIRLLEVKHYMGYFKKYPVLGVGMPNQLWPAALEADGLNKEYYYTDVGIIGLMFLYGVAGLTWLFYFIFTVFRKSWKLQRDSIEFSFIIGFFTFCTAIATTILYFLMPQNIIHIMFVLAVLGNMLQSPKSQAGGSDE